MLKVLDNGKDIPGEVGDRIFDEGVSIGASLDCLLSGIW